jgi:hypothetical protein
MRQFAGHPDPRIISLRLALFALCLFGFVASASGQEEEEFASQSAVVRRATPLKTARAASQPSLWTLQLATRVGLLELTPRAGFVHVITAEGRRGWVVAGDVSPAPPPPHPPTIKRVVLQKISDYTRY